MWRALSWQWQSRRLCWDVTPWTLCGEWQQRTPNRRYVSATQRCVSRVSCRRYVQIRAVRSSTQGSSPGTRSFLLRTAPRPTGGRTQPLRQCSPVYRCHRAENTCAHYSWGALDQSCAFSISPCISLLTIFSPTSVCLRLCSFYTYTGSLFYLTNNVRHVLSTRVWYKQ
jgi:hypothetical protein